MKTMITMLNSPASQVTWLRHCFVVCALLLGSSSTETRAQGTSELPVSFLAQVEGGWKRLVEADSSWASYSVEYRSTRKSEKWPWANYDRDWSIRVARAAKGLLIEYPDRLDAVNPNYTFRLERTWLTGAWAPAAVASV